MHLLIVQIKGIAEAALRKSALIKGKFQNKMLEAQAVGLHHGRRRESSACRARGVQREKNVSLPKSRSNGRLGIESIRVETRSKCHANKP
jgi:hypothetical protein